ncbi:MAG TPA: hypothetical protein VM118_12450 [Acidobacteriota bacterium]|nr:hypothetical protein [Acidobacteriota bacterium]
MTPRKSRKKPHKAPPPRRQRSRLSRSLLILIAGIIVALAVHAGVAREIGYDAGWGSWFTQDDAFISYRYARNALDGHGLVFNAGERVEGYTNVLWVIWLVLAGVLGNDFDAAAKFLGLLSAGGLIVLAGLLARGVWARLGLKHAEIAGVLGALLVAVNGSVAYWALSGLETAWFGLLVTASVWWWVRGSRMVIAGLALAAMTRPEGGLVWLILVVAEWLIGDGWKRALVVLASVGVLLVPYAIFKLVYYGSLFPNPFYAKTGFAWEYFASGFEYVWLYFQHYGLWGIVPLLVLIAVRPLTGRWRILPLIWLVYTVYIMAVGGDVLRPHRFFVPITVFMVVSAIGGLGWLCARTQWKQFSIWVAAAAAAILGVWGYIAPREIITSTRALEIGLLNKMATLADRLSAVDPTPFTIAVSTIGKISYDLPGRRVIDMLGLTDTTIARHPEAIPGNVSTWKERNFNVTYVLSQDPDYILFSTGHKPSAPAERALILHQKYRRNYYTILFPTPRRNLAVHKRRGDYAGPDSVWPSIELAHEVNRAFNFQISDQLDSSLAVLYRLKREGPGDFSLPDEFISNVYMQQGKYDQALASADTALAIDSFSVTALQTKLAVAQRLSDTAGVMEVGTLIGRVCPWMLR